MDAKPRKTSPSGARSAAQWFESLASAGVTHVGRRKMKPAAAKPSPPKTASAADSRATRGSTTTPQHAPAAGQTVVAPGDGHAALSRGAAGIGSPNSKGASSPGAILLPLASDPWEALRAEVRACERCQELAATRTQTVFGVGNRLARLCFLGEAPGADEDRQGEPFVGAAGQLLNKIMAACRMAREDVYILNVLKCRPPGNRAPAPDEATNCREYLDRQLALLQPEFICCLGAVAAQNLLGTTTPIGKLRGKLHAVGAMQVLCTYHPAYLLRNPSAKRDVWEDMKLLMAAMGTPVE